MGVNDRVQNRKDEKRAAQQQRRQVGRGSGKGAATADWETCDGTLLAVMVARVAVTGGAVRLGYTRDGGAYAVGFYGFGEPYTVYISPSEDVNEWLKRTIGDLESDDIPTAT